MKSWNRGCCPCFITSMWAMSRVCLDVTRRELNRCKINTYSRKDISNELVSLVSMLYDSLTQ